MKKKETIFGALAIVGAALLWSLDGTFLRPQFYNMSAELLVFLEHGLGSLLFLFFCFSGGKQIKGMKKEGRGALLWVSMFGGILGTVFITKAFFLAIDGEISFSTVIILQKLQPIFALFIARVFLKEKLHKSFYGRALVAIGAAYILSFGGKITFLSLDLTHSGAIFAIFAAFAFGSSTVMSKKLTASLDAKRSAGMRFIMVTFIMGIYLFFSGGFDALGGVSSLQRKYLMIIVLSSGGLALFLYYYGLRRIKSSQSTVLELARPLSAVFLDRVINGNILSSTQRVATGILLIAMVKIGRKQL